MRKRKKVDLNLWRHTDVLVRNTHETLALILPSINEPMMAKLTTNISNNNLTVKTDSVFNFSVPLR